MSRIFEAFQQSEGVEPNLIVQLIEDVPMLPSFATEKETGNTPGESNLLVEELAEPIGGGSLTGNRNYRRAPINITSDVPFFPFDDHDSRAAEEYRILRTNILQHPAQPRVLAITSGSAGDGKTVTAINIAGILALKTDARVLMVDADLRRSSVAAELSIDAIPGLNEVLSGNCRMEDAIVQVDQIPNLYVLPSGAAAANPVELLDSPLFRSFADAIRREFSFVVFDTCPATTVADFKLVLQVCDGVLIVVRPDHTNRTAFLEALQIEPKQKLLGTVINGIDDWFLWRRREGYGYYHGPPRERNGFPRQK